MVRYFLAAAILWITSPALAWVHGLTPSPGNAQLNVGAVAPAQFINILKSAGLSFAAPADAALLDAGGYLVGTPSGAVSLINMSTNIIYTGVTYKMRFTSGVTARISIGSGISGCVATGTASFTGCAGVNGVITNTGGDGSVTFTLPSGGFSATFPASFTYAHSGGEIALYRLSDETAFLNGEIWSPEYRSVLSSLRSRTIRTMGLTNIGATGNFNGETTWANRIATTDLTWNGPKIPPRIYGGTISGTDTYTAAAAPSTPVSWTDGEQYIGITTNANTSSSVTLDIGSRGAKTVVDKNVTALTTGCSAGSNTCLRANTLGTFTYDALLDVLLYNAGGITAGIPWEAHISLANRTSGNVWPILPAWALDSYATSWASLICSTLNSGLIPYFEYANEVWNSGFTATQWAANRGTALGWATPTFVPSSGWYALRARQVLGTLITAVPSCANRTIRRVMAYQAAGDTTNQTQRFQGTQLCPSPGAGCGNATYNTWTSSADYTAVGQRPIDVSEVLSYATYVSGANLCRGPDFGCTLTASNVPFLQSLVTAWEGGDTAVSMALIDDDLRLGRILVQNATASGTTFSTPAAHGFSVGSAVAFQVIGGTAYSGVVVNQLYDVTGTSSAGCAGGVTCNFTMRAYSGGRGAGSNINGGSAGSGTMTVGVTGSSSAGFASILFAAGRYQGFGEANAALYDAPRDSLAPLRVEQYEGNLEPVGPSAGECTSLGITGSNCTASIAAAILAWKQSNSASLTQQLFYNVFMGTITGYPVTFGLMTHSQTPSQLVVPDNCTNTLAYVALLAGCLPNSGLSPAGQGYQSFSTNWLLKRDLDPASNDNDPMWLEKAA